MPKVFTRKELEQWLWEIVSNNDNDFGESVKEIINRLDGFDRYVEYIRKYEE